MAVPSSGGDRLRRLEELDVTEAELQESAFIGCTAAAGCTSNDPRSLPGTIAWGKTIAHLRDVKKVDGWLANRDWNFETVVHPSRSHAIAVAAGTPATGRREGAVPRTRTPKGEVTSRRVDRNAQLSLGDGTNVFVGPGIGPAIDEVIGEVGETWMYLHYFDKRAEEIRLELSLPLEMRGKQITAWRERIIIGAVPFAADLEIALGLDDDAPIDIDIARKAD